MSKTESELKEVHYLVYASMATERFSERELPDLLTCSRDRNRDAEITGMLLYRDGRFLQLLEGPEDAIDALFTRIRRDRRHKDVELLNRGILSARIFPEWSMGYRNLMGPKKEDLPGYSECLQPGFKPATQQKALQHLLALFARTLDTVAA